MHDNVAGETTHEHVVSPATEGSSPDARNLTQETGRRAAQALLRRRRSRTAPPPTTRSAAIPPKIMPLAPV